MVRRHERARGGPDRRRLRRRWRSRRCCFVRRSAPDGSYFNDGDRAAGVFGVLATGFAVLLGLVVVLAFTSYDESRAGAEAEALTLAQQFEVAHLLPDEPGQRLAGQLICYGRYVVHQEWPRMEAGTLGDAVNPWGVATFRTMQTVEPRTAAEQAAYAKWLDQRLDREAARNDRIHGAAGVIPTPLWLVLFVTAVVILGEMQPDVAREVVEDPRQQVVVERRQDDRAGDDAPDRAQPAEHDHGEDEDRERERELGAG